MLQASTFLSDDLVQITKKLTSLRSFAYESETRRAKGRSFFAKKVVTVLVKYGGHSLEHLVMNGEDKNVSTHRDSGKESMTDET